MPMSENSYFSILESDENMCMTITFRKMINLFKEPIHTYTYTNFFSSIWPIPYLKRLDLLYLLMVWYFLKCYNFSDCKYFYQWSRVSVSDISHPSSQILNYLRNMFQTQSTSTISTLLRILIWQFEPCNKLRNFIFKRKIFDLWF